jgi:hypothetical protein
MKGIDSTGALLVHVPGWVDGWKDGWMEVKAILRIAYSNKKYRMHFVSTYYQNKILGLYPKMFML